MTFEKKLIRGNAYRAIIDFEFTETGASDHTCTVTPKTGYFHGKTKISKTTLRVIYNSLLKILQWAMYLAFSSFCAKLLPNLTQNARL